MEVKPGYKRTEVGIIPQEWNAVPMESITTHIGDGLHGTPVYSSNGEYFFINGNNLHDGKIVVTSETKAVGQSEFVKHQKPLSDRSILMSINGTIGKLALFDGEAIVLGKSAAYVNVKKEISKPFVYHSLQTEIVKRQFLDGLTGSTIGNLGLTTIRSAQIPLPPTETEQSVIAEALSDVDATLGALDRLIAKKRDLKRAAMQQLLTGQTRLAGFHGEWKVRLFGDVAVPRRDRVDPRRTGVHDFCIELEHIASASGELLGSTSTGTQSSLKSVFCPGDVLFGKLRAYLRKYWLATRSGVCSTEIWVFTPKDSAVKTEFLFQVIKTDEFIEAASNSYGTHMPRSDWIVVKSHGLKIPPLAEQTAIAEVLSEMDAELASLERRRDKTRALKEGMMQELLSGRTRLI
jgi:type I restriction enzyme S subunit